MAGMVDPTTSLPKIYQTENLENYLVASMAGMVDPYTSLPKIYQILKNDPWRTYASKKDL